MGKDVSVAVFKAFYSYFHLHEVGRVTGSRVTPHYECGVSEFRHQVLLTKTTVIIIITSFGRVCLDVLFTLKSLDAPCAQVSVIDEGLLRFSKLEELVLSANKITEVPAEHLPGTLKASLLDQETSPVSFAFTRCSPTKGPGAPVQPSGFPRRARQPPASTPAVPQPGLQHSGFL